MSTPKELVYLDLLTGKEGGISLFVNRDLQRIFVLMWIDSVTDLEATLTSTTAMALSCALRRAASCLSKVDACECVRVIENVECYGDYPEERLLFSTGVAGGGVALSLIPEDWFEVRCSISVTSGSLASQVMDALTAEDLFYGPGCVHRMTQKVAFELADLLDHAAEGLMVQQS